MPKVERDAQTEAFLRAVEGLPSPRRHKQQLLWSERVAFWAAAGAAAFLLSWMWWKWGLVWAIASAGVAFAAHKWNANLERQQRMRELAERLRE